MTRWQAVKLFIICSIAIIPEWIAFSIQAVFGNPERVKHIALAKDITCNNAFGGTIGKTVSWQVGRAADAGKPWAIKLAKWIDNLFGENHCIDTYLTSLVIGEQESKV